MLARGIFNFKKITVAQIFDNKLYLNLIKLGINIARSLNLFNILSVLNNKKIKLLNSFLKINIKPLRQKSDTKKSLKALYFKGCINNYINPSTQNAIEKILDKTEIEIIEAPFHCCGLPLNSAGDFESFKQIAKKNHD